jgi:hypothetical protein
MSKIFRLFLVLSLIFVVYALQAQPGDPGGNPDNPVPLGGLELLIGGGLLLGIRSLLSRRKK